ncbi:MAG: hypothetical protein JSW59_00830 [Phycisphaerales bacterium]|nr:MAG: hypothetical protein JSW59_00830 [Phycisphaerales bacterium]
MARAPKSQESGEAEGAPKWMVTYSDCMTLLLTFFVLLLTFSTFDTRFFRNLRAIYCRAFTTISVVRRSDRDAIVDMPPLIERTVELDKGSERPTTIRGRQDNLMKAIDVVDPRPGMAFVISSKRLFWGRGTAFSSEGSNTMDLVGSFLAKVPSRVVVSETGAADDRTSVNFGLPRAWAVVDYLTTRAGLDRERFSISQSSSLPRGSNRTGSGGSRSERKVEIALLERSIYN